MKKSFADYLLVGSQFGLFILFVFDLSASFVLPVWLKGVAFGSACLGLLVCVLAVLQLRNSLTAFPTPKDNSSLIINGLYQYVRHPIYTGILLTVFGYSFYSTSYSRLGISIALTFLFFIKTEYEERQLTKKYSAYPEYAKKTGRFFPKLVSSFRI
ncbi:MAG: methyltransferase family protein [Spirosomataceae bacterium]